MSGKETFTLTPKGVARLSSPCNAEWATWGDWMHAMHCDRREELKDANKLVRFWNARSEVPNVRMSDGGRET